MNQNIELEKHIGRIKDMLNMNADPELEELVKEGEQALEDQASGTIKILEEKMKEITAAPASSFPKKAAGEEGEQPVRKKDKRK